MSIIDNIINKKKSGGTPKRQTKGHGVSKRSAASYKLKKEVK